MKKLVILFSLALLSGSCFSSKLDDIKSQLDDLEWEQMMKANQYQLDEVLRDIKIQRQLNQQSQKSPAPAPNTARRMYMNGECVIPKNISDVSKVKKIVGFEDGNYITFSYFFASENWINKDRLVMGEDYSSIDSNKINSNYSKTKCPKPDSIFNIDEYLKSPKK